jgi:hypothetical protein
MTLASPSHSDLTDQIRRKTVHLTTWALQLYSITFALVYLLEGLTPVYSHPKMIDIEVKGNSIYLEN